MRRRNLLGAKALVVTMSEYAYSATPAAVSRNVYVYYGGQPIKDMTSSMFTRTGNMQAPTINNTYGRITINVNSNTSTTSSVASTLTFTYQGQSVLYTVTQPNDYVVSTQTITGTGCDTCDAVPSASSLFTISENGGVYTNSSFTLKVGEKFSTSYTKYTYASGNIANGSTTKSNVVNEYVTVGTGELPIASVPTSVGGSLLFSSSKTFTNSDSFSITLDTSTKWENITVSSNCSSGGVIGNFKLQNASTNTYRFYSGDCGF